MKKFLIIVSIMFSLLLLSCGSKSADSNPGKSSDKAINKSDSSKSMKGRQSKAGEGRGGRFQRMAQATAVPVEVTYLTTGNISSYLMYSSVLETEQTVDVFSRIAGLVEKLYVEEGMFVKQNQPLLQLEQAEYKLQEENARIQFDKAKTEFNRLKALLEKNLISQEEFDNSRLTLQQAEISWKQAKLNLDYTIVRSPINGVVGERFVRLGDRIQPSTRLFVISNLDDKVVKLYVPQEELPNCYVNQPAIVISDVLPDIKFTGWVKRISPIIDPQSGTFKVTVGVKDPQNRLKPGMFLNAELIVANHENARLIPKAALIYEGEKALFFIVEDNKARRIELKKGFEDNEKVEVLNDLPVGTSVVVLGQNGLKEGSPIKVVNTQRYAWQTNWPEKPAAMERVRRPDRPKPQRDG